MSIKIYGKNPSVEILQSDKKIFKAFVIENTNQDIVLKLKKKNIEIKPLSKHDFKKQFLGNHQGIVLEIEDYKTINLSEFLNKIDLTNNPLILMLDGITDPHNFGAIIRSAEAGGVKGIIIPKNRSVKITGTVAKVSSGAIEYVDIIEVTNLRNTLDTLKEKGFWTVGTDLNAKKSYREIDVSTPLVLVIGSEGKGISKLIKNNVDYNVKIDMIGKINSLNASVSAGILIFEILRKKL
ncbi:23S rRNA (guanosine(2251)-2'-O)-methyltransferase RlmB [Candidatus Izemoplasma sp. B36]|uniref:23S rRNA (guanosine(2251)-2'-O)-methyltransferase RlmB n=1 Tax=Candidatus Izemoplasma sp. B36 TaxID=3242468 RepID=UPI0035566EB8